MEDVRVGLGVAVVREVVAFADVVHLCVVDDVRGFQGQFRALILFEATIVVGRGNDATLIDTQYVGGETGLHTLGFKKSGSLRQ